MLPPTAAPNFVTLTQQYRDLAIEFPKLKGVTLAQWAYESGWGGSGLSAAHLNFAGMKWGNCDAHYGTLCRYGGANYTHFTSLQMFIEAYWHRLDTVSVFKGWRDHAGDPQDFITQITPGWLNGRITVPTGFLLADERTYVNQVMSIRNQRTEELFKWEDKQPPAKGPPQRPASPGWWRWWR